MADLESLRSGADTASLQASTMQASLPSVLQELKGSLNEIFNKDNPLVKERTGYLENYLSAGDRARASYLPQKSGFAYSPTELNALTSSAQASALAPLATVNQMLMGQYGGLKDYLGQAKDLFSARVQAAYENAQRMRQRYGDEVARQQQEFENNLALQEFALKKKGSGTGLGLSTTLNKPTFTPTTSNLINNWAQGVSNLFGGAPQQDTAAASMAAVPNLNQASGIGKWWNKLFGAPEPLINIPSGTNLRI